MSERNSQPVDGDVEPFDADAVDPDTTLTETPLADLADVDAADAAEQQRLADDVGGRTHRTVLPDDVDPADAADQYREVDLDEDDYR